VETRVLSTTREVIIGGGRPTVLIGERINPTGKKRLAEALRAGDLSVAREEALAQVAAGADVLDVNVGATGVDDRHAAPCGRGSRSRGGRLPCIDSRKPGPGGGIACAWPADRQLCDGEEVSLEEVLHS
jgi:5-methyltetrahydrofolate--homocysteine methyltransferase